MFKDLDDLLLLEDSSKCDQPRFQPEPYGYMRHTSFQPPTMMSQPVNPYMAMFP